MASATTALADRVCSHGHIGQYAMVSGKLRCQGCRRAEKRTRYVTHRDAEVDRSKRYAAANPEVRKRISLGRDPAKGAAYYAANKERAAASSHEWYLVNKTTVVQRARLRRAEYDRGDFTQAEWNDMVLAARGRCLDCGRDDLALTVDHVIPLVKGGIHTANNIQPLCGPCNKRKFTKVTDFRPTGWRFQEDCSHRTQHL